MYLWSYIIKDFLDIYEIYIHSQSAAPGAPLSTVFGNFGVNTPKFCKEFNDFTIKLPKFFFLKVRVFFFTLRAFKFEYAFPSLYN